jgi:mRNA interferase MazF
MKRGEITPVAGGKDYAVKPRPVLIVQDNNFDATDSITICAFKTDPVEASLLRLVVHPSPVDGLRETSRLMVDTIKTVSKTKIGNKIGRLADEDMVRFN